MTRSKSYEIRASLVNKFIRKIEFFQKNARFSKVTYSRRKKCFYLRDVMKLESKNLWFPRIFQIGFGTIANVSLNKLEDSRRPSKYYWINRFRRINDNLFWDRVRPARDRSKNRILIDENAKMNIFLYLDSS